MSKIYQALEKASQESTKALPPAQITLQLPAAGKVALDDEMAFLHDRVESLLANSSHKIIQFIGCDRGGGVSTIVREFAKTAVEKLGKSVLILDSALQDATQKLNLNVTCECKYLDQNQDEEVSKNLFRFGDSNLFFAPISVQASLVSPATGFASRINGWDTLKGKFDLILIDASSSPKSMDSIAMASKVDGVVMVLEAGKTSRSAAERLKKRIITNGGVILGVVLNRRRYYIPKWLYKRL